MAEVSNAIFTTLVLCVVNLAAVLGGAWLANLLFAF